MYAVPVIMTGIKGDAYTMSQCPVDISAIIRPKKKKIIVKFSLKSLLELIWLYTNFSIATCFM